MKFARCLRFVLEKEGGYVNHLSDPGGATNMGITHRVYSRWVGRDVTEEEMRSLNVFDVAPIYEKLYWQKLNCYWLPVGVDLLVFDMGVNAGVSTAAKMLQKEVGGLVVDGIVGDRTIEETNLYVKENSYKELIDYYTDARICYYRQLDHFDVFGRGWTNRARSAQKKAMEMVENYG